MDKISSLLGYLRMMRDVLNRKKNTLLEILEVSEYQNELLKETQMDEEAFSGTLSKKAGLIEKINEMDDGFNALYKSIENEIKNAAGDNADIIREIQSLITEVTELGVKITVLEKKNKETLDKKVASIRQGKKNFRVNRQTADKYYKNMAGLGGSGSAFMDQKN